MVFTQSRHHCVRPKAVDDNQQYASLLLQQVCTRFKFNQSFSYIFCYCTNRLINKSVLLVILYLRWLDDGQGDGLIVRTIPIDTRLLIFFLNLSLIFFLHMIVKVVCCF